MKVLAVSFLLLLTSSQGFANVSEIVGGSDAFLGEFPYQVSLQNTLNPLSPFHFCGGSIYNELFVITAAHCVAKLRDPSKLQVVAGVLNLVVSEGKEQVRKVVKIITHQNYNASIILNDIALLKLKDPFVLNDFVQPVRLPAAGQITTGKCIVTGWGLLSEGGDTPQVLQKVTIPIVSDEECRKRYSASLIADSMICAGYVNTGGKDSCNGDSGGPMLCAGYLGGIVSWGRGCARPGYPGVYTETAYFVDWIKKNAV